MEKVSNNINIKVNKGGDNMNNIMDLIYKENVKDMERIKETIELNKIKNEIIPQIVKVIEEARTKSETYLENVFDIQIENENIRKEYKKKVITRAIKTFMAIREHAGFRDALEIIRKTAEELAGIYETIKVKHRYALYMEEEEQKKERKVEKLEKKVLYEIIFKEVEYEPMRFLFISYLCGWTGTISFANCFTEEEEENTLLCIEAGVTKQAIKFIFNELHFSKEYKKKLIKWLVEDLKEYILKRSLTLNEKEFLKCLSSRDFRILPEIMEDDGIEEEKINVIKSFFTKHGIELYV